MRHEGKKQEIAISKEAKDCSNITVSLKASFFEFVKANFIDDLENNENILKIDNAEGAKAATESHGDAYVEYSMDITFKTNLSTHTVKLTAYTTSSQLYIQPIGEKSGPKDHLGNKGSPRYVVENFLLPWSEKSISEKKFTESTQKMYIAALKEEIKKLEQKRATKQTQDPLNDSENSVAKGDAKCAAKNCSYQGLNPQNKSAVGVCANCGQFEHFACVKIKAEHKEDIMKGIRMYYCSCCFSKNPLNPSRKTDGSPDLKSVIPMYRTRIGSIPIMGQGYLENKNVRDKDKNLKCEICEFVAQSIQEIGDHLERSHKPRCTTCDKVFCTVKELQDHTESEHNIACEYCDDKFQNRSSFEDHKKEAHSYPYFDTLKRMTWESVSGGGDFDALKSMTSK